MRLINLSGGSDQLQDSETRGATGDDASASFEFVPSLRYASKARPFSLSAMGAGEWMVRAPGEIGYSMHLDELLRRNGASNVRWFSDGEWNARASGKERPY